MEPDEAHGGATTDVCQGQAAIGFGRIGPGFCGRCPDSGRHYRFSVDPFARIDQGGGRQWLVFDGAFGPLRNAPPLVVRWIKTYVTYDTIDRRIIKVTMTIEGEKLE
jgi:hypothetical protein